MSKQLLQMGFKEADPTIKKRLIVAVESLEKEGKTHFALTAPGPIALFDFDTGLEGVVNKFASQKKIYVIDYREMGSDKDKWPVLWAKFVREYTACLADPTIRTIVWDTATEAWELLRLARFGKLTQVMPYHYGPVNAEFRKVIRDAFASDKNLIMLQKMKAEWVNEKSTGKFVRSGFSETGYMVQVNLRMWRDDDNDFHMFVKDCRQNGSVAGLDLTNDMANFSTLAACVFPETSEKDWS